MPRELPLAIPLEVIESELFNAAADRTVQRYASASSRDSSHPTPEDGEMSYLADTGQVEVRHGGSWLGLLPTGIMLPWTAGVAQVPSGWLLCNGQEVSRSTYGALHALYSAADYPHGNGNGSTTFNVPDMRQRFPLGLAVSGTGSTLGETGGNIDHVHTGPNHSHNVSMATANAGSHSHGISGSTGNTAIAHTHELGGSTGSAGSHSHSFSDTSSSSSNNVTTTATSGSALVLAFSSHTHSVSGTTSSGGSHSHSLPANTGTTSSSTNHNHSVSITSSTDGTHAHSISGSTANSGTGNTGTANPPYLSVPFIVKT